MRKAIFSLLIVSTIIVGCKKSDKEDTSLKTVTYVFAPNGANSQVIYKSLIDGTQINAGYKVALFSVNDQVKIGDKTTLIMSTTSTPPSNYQIRISYNGKEIATTATFTPTKNLVLEKTFTKEDFR